MPTNPVIFYDGWPLVHAPLSPPALHLRDTLAARPEGFEYHIALPQTGTPGLPEDMVQRVVQTGNSPIDRLRWEQRTLPHLAAKLGAALHLNTTTAPLFSRRPVLVSPAGDGEPDDPGTGFTHLLRTSLGRGGTSNSRILWPADLPYPIGMPEVMKISRSPHPAFKPHEFFLPPAFEGAPDLPATYYLVHIRPDEEAIRRALKAWTWAAGPIGEVYPLLFLDLPSSLESFARLLAREHHIREETLFFYPALPADSLHRLYQAASALFLPQAASPWGSPLQYALACGLPVVALETAVSSAIAGPAAYLIPDQDPRGMGSALIAVIIKDHLRKQLADAALEQVAKWSPGKARKGLAEAYSATG